MIHIECNEKKISLISKEQTLTFDLLLGYICPTCNKIILAYWLDNGEQYNLLDFIESSDDRNREEHYITFFTDRARGIELRNHTCKYIFSNLDIRENLMELVLHLDISIYKDLIAALDFSELSTEKIVEILGTYETVFIFDICTRGSPMFIIDIEKIIGKYDNLVSWNLYQDIKKRNIEKFLSRLLNFEDYKYFTVIGN